MTLEMTSAKLVLDGEIADLREHVGDDSQTRAGQDDANPVNLGTKPAKCEWLTRLILWQLEKIDNGQDSSDTSTEVVPKPPSERRALKQPTEDQAHGESKRLAETQTREADVSPLPRRHGIGQDTECRWKTHRGCYALEGAEQDELDTRLGDTAGQNEDAQKKTTDEVDYSVSHKVGQ